MLSRLPAFAWKIVVIGAVALFATATLTYAASTQPSAAPAAAAVRPAPAHPAVLVVPDVRRQAFVFAKLALQDAGFAWRVAGRVQGFAPNIVLSQSPAAGTRLYDTGAPLVRITLERNGKYAQAGQPEDASPYKATPLQSAEGALAPAPTLRPAVKPAARPKVTRAVPAAKPAVKPAARVAAAHYPQNRPAAFARAGAPKEPLDEMPLPDRARALGQWLAAGPKASDANVRRWLYQNAWVVAGARFGWWRGATALRILIAVDRRTETVWGIGSKNRSTAEDALSQVEARSR